MTINSLNNVIELIKFKYRFTSNQTLILSNSQTRSNSHTRFIQSQSNYDKRFNRLELMKDFSCAWAFKLRSYIAKLSWCMINNSTFLLIDVNFCVLLQSLMMIRNLIKWISKIVFLERRLFYIESFVFSTWQQQDFSESYTSCCLLQAFDDMIMSFDWLSTSMSMLTFDNRHLESSLTFAK